MKPTDAIHDPAGGDGGGVLADRFELGARAGEGAMGRVYRAWDRERGRPVAVKVLSDPSADAVARFQREAQVLAEIDHAGVVGYVDRGATGDGTLWLAMDWIEGETLAARLRRGALSIDETVALGCGVARGLGAAHRRGLTHRDVKPANLLLPGGALGGVIVVDFGVVHTNVREATAAGAILGTPGYMAPEQARGVRGVDARADVFALGCVLFECLTGVPAFSGDHLLAILAKILLDESPRVSELRPETPAALDDLIAAMLAKEPAHRPGDGDAVAAELEVIRRAGAHAPRRIAVPPSLTAGEQRILSVVLAADPQSTDDATLSPAASLERDRSLTEALPTGARIERLADGTFLLAMWGQTSARDQAGQAARAALEMTRRLGDRVVVATGRGVLSGRLPVGEVIDRAVRMLRRRGAQAQAPRVWLDELTAGLLDSHFHVRVEDDGFVFVGEHPRSDGARQVCGVVTSCVGRDRELAQLREMYTEVRTRSVARAAVIVAPAGVGKSRVRQELARWIASAGDHEALLGRGDPLRIGSPFAVLGHALRWAMGLADGETPQAHLRRIAAHVARFFERGAEAARVTRFLGELVGVGAAEALDDDVAVIAARRVPQLMGDL
ncbi:MAG: protein kinase, partial [Deltaproteobacteria bacterium]|nr:protein kinase [Deltaproteobacteria bacterium]